MIGTNRYIGSPVERIEDLRFLRGRGEFVGDLQRGGMLHAAILRSPIAHGRIRGLDSEPARAIPGVRAVITAAEIGAVVPVGVEVNAPMTPQSYVKHIYIVADKNRIPIVTRVALTPASGQAYMGANIRLGETTDVRAIVEQSDGTLLALTREVKVTVGGCGG